MNILFIVFSAILFSLYFKWKRIAKVMTAYCRQHNVPEIDGKTFEELWLRWVKKPLDDIFSIYHG